MYEGGVPSHGTVHGELEHGSYRGLYGGQRTSGAIKVDPG